MHFLYSILSIMVSCPFFSSVLAQPKFPAVLLAQTSMQAFQLIQLLPVHLRDSVLLVGKCGKQFSFVPVLILLMKMDIYVSKIIIFKRSRESLSRKWVEAMDQELRERSISFGRVEFKLSRICTQDWDVQHDCQITANSFLSKEPC